MFKRIIAGRSLRDVAFMGIMRNTLLTRHRDELHVPVEQTYGYITKLQLEENHIKKGYTNDARCIAGFPKAVPCDGMFRTSAIRHHNRQIHRGKFLKGGIRKKNQAPYLVKGLRLWYKVQYYNEECFITERRCSGYFLCPQKVRRDSCFKQRKLQKVDTA